MRPLTTRLIAKPHIIRFLDAQYSDHRGLIRITGRGLLFDSIKGNLTPDFHSRAEQAPSGHLFFHCVLPSPYKTFYLAQEQVKSLSKSLEEYFWLKANDYILTMMANDSIYKDQAIKQFREEYGIDEECYPIDHFRRQITRLKVPGMKPQSKEIVPRLSSKLTNQECMQIYRSMRLGISSRLISRNYDITHRQAQKIFKKISQLLSKKFPESFQNDMSITKRGNNKQKVDLILSRAEHLEKLLKSTA